MKVFESTTEQPISSKDVVSVRLETSKNQKITVMTQDEIIRCVDLIRTGTPKEQAAATEEITLRNKPLILHLIKQMYSSYASKYGEDMLSCGYIGIIQALHKADPPYDPRISTFSTFVKPYIIHEISDCISQMVHNTSSHYAASAKKINRAIALLNQRGIENPTIPDIMTETNLGADAIQTVLLMQSANAALPLDHPNVMDLPSEDYASPPEIIEQRELQQALQNAMLKLSENECLVLELQYGLNGHERHKQSEIAKILGNGTTVYQVHRIRARAYKKLFHDKTLRSYFEYEYQKNDEYNALLEEVSIPLVVGAESIDREMQFLSEIPIEEISL